MDWEWMKCQVTLAEWSTIDEVYNTTNIIETGLVENASFIFFNLGLDGPEYLQQDVY